MDKSVQEDEEMEGLRDDVPSSESELTERQSQGKDIANNRESSLNCEKGNTEDESILVQAETKHEERDYSDVLPERLTDQIKGVIYGNCIGDAVGLLTEFMSKEEARSVYGDVGKHFFTKDINLEYNMKSDDGHRIRWVQGDWTDDSDQMILILQTLLEGNGQFDKLVFANKMVKWCRRGFPELGDIGGMGRGMTTSKVLEHPYYLTDPHKAAHDIWVRSGYFVAPNGGVMRTSILGTMEFHNLDKVIENTKNACMVTHADPRCVASCVAVTTAIALMLQGKYKIKNGNYDVDKITKEAHALAEQQLEKDEHKKELHEYMFETKLDKLKLGESIGYTFKCLGAGFWGFKQKDFRTAIQQVTMEAGDADTNCAVAGALLGCKLGFNNLPKTWISGLAHRDWLEDHIARYLKLLCTLK
ncbi:uncharacterized protein LOC114537610 [Dendronephthya gigantea]|uniref:uncharacterized protein LOC114537610 n=1 Tax=Dendronephthya gigantea TaxID=151771 RepID=UPI001069105B|nr:uncharacterized protein LOC114537610 [Dendronephthya gigantea]